MNSRLSLLLPLAALGCGGVSTQDQPDAGMPDADSPAVRTVTGTTVDTYVTATGLVNVARDISDVTVAAHVPDGQGSYQTIAGTAGVDGTFTIEDVPEGNYLLQVGISYRVTSSSALDLGSAVLGRPNAQLASAGTTLTLDISGLTQFQGEELDLFAPNARAFQPALSEVLNPPLADGVVVVDGTLDWEIVNEPGIIESSRGDLAYLLKRAAADAPNGILIITQFSELAPFTMSNGGDTTVAGRFVSPPADQTVDVTFDPADWVAVHADFGPTTSPPTPTLGLFVNPFSDQFADLSPLEVARVTPSAAINQTVNYANPFPSDWLVVDSTFSFGLGFIDSPANATIGLSFVGRFGAIGTVSADMAPRISPVRSPKADGKNLSSPQTSGPTPVISFEAPALGTPNSYSVVVREIGVGSRGIPIASFSTPDTSLVIPPGLLESGKRYFFEIDAFRDTIDHNTAPFRRDADSESDSSRLPTAPLTIE